MPRNDDSLERLRAAIDQLAATDAADLLNEARIEARARVRATLADALAHSMLERLHEQLPDPARDTAPPSSERRGSVPPRDQPAPRRNPVRREPDDADARPAPSSDDPAWYVYGVIDGEAELDGSLDGVDPAHAVATLREGTLAAVSSLVPLEEFGEVQLREHLADMAWVEATARTHEAVLEAVRDQTTVIPMRMCTVYRTEDGIRDMLAREAVPFRDALDRLDGKAEWGVKVFTSLAPADESRTADAGANDSSSADDSPGAAYMERRRTDRERRQRALQMAEAAADLIHERLSAMASDAQVISLQRPEVTGHSGDMILNGVYLVPDDAAEAFHEEVRALAAELEPNGIELYPTGPWPAYNFVPGTIGAAW
ncbi:MAG TPA: GvpL/GvpF family gas vesicle protein [Solirubrobacteraceae bacterium]|nr:GvpL/GvpF family gas vesicle protein [Solirubrobacteraceae bacterium]